MTIQDLATEANDLKAKLQAAVDAAQNHYTNVRNAKLGGVSETWVNTARGAGATALQSLNVHVQNLNKKMADAAAAGPRIEAEAEKLAAEVEAANQ